jgi:hypothetical protein
VLRGVQLRPRPPCTMVVRHYRGMARLGAVRLLLGFCSVLLAVHAQPPSHEKLGSASPQPANCSSFSCGALAPTTPIPSGGCAGSVCTSEECCVGGAAEGGLLPPSGWFPFAVIIVSLVSAVGLSKFLEQRGALGRAGGEYSAVDHH